MGSGRLLKAGKDEQKQSVALHPPYTHTQPDNLVSDFDSSGFVHRCMGMLMPSSWRLLLPLRRFKNPLRVGTVSSTSSKLWGALEMPFLKAP